MESNNDYLPGSANRELVRCLGEEGKFETQ
jgi:hypothetical protein